MRRTLVSSLLLLLVLCPVIAHAGAVKMLFWYPGEAGSTEEAQPVIDAFLDYVNGKIGAGTVVGRYVNTDAAGIASVKKERPAIGIVSYAAWVQHKAELAGATVVLATLPLPAGQKTERYALVSATGKIPAGAQILSSEPLSPAFVRAELFPNLPADAKISQTPQLLFKLKEIGEGKSNAVAILTPTEAATLAQVSAAWSQGVKTIAPSKPVPTARVLLFDPAWKDVAKFKAALLGAGADPKAKEILTEMRLKGFSE